jgi:hypothetical protein
LMLFFFNARSDGETSSCTFSSSFSCEPVSIVRTYFRLLSMKLKVRFTWLFCIYFPLYMKTIKSRESSLTDQGLEDRMIGVRIPGGTENFSLRRRVQTRSGAHTASYSMRTRGSFSGGKAAGEWSWPLTSI